jgi:hypothetical protein
MMEEDKLLEFINHIRNIEQLFTSCHTTLMAVLARLGGDKEAFDELCDARKKWDEQIESISELFMKSKGQ